MAKTKKNTRSRFEGLNLDSLTKDTAKVTNQSLEGKDLPIMPPPVALDAEKTPVIESTAPNKSSLKSQGRPKASQRKPLNTAIEPLNKKRLEFVAMLNGGSVADQLNNILEKYFTEIEQVDELIEIFEARKKARNKE